MMVMTGTFQEAIETQIDRCVAALRETGKVPSPDLFGLHALTGVSEDDLLSMLFLLVQ